MPPVEDVAVTISYRTIGRVLLTLFGLLLLYQLRDVLVLFLVVVAVVVALSPIVKSWEKHISRTLAIFLLYLSIIIAIVIIAAVILPPVINQLDGFLNYLNTVLAANGFTPDTAIQRVRNGVQLFLAGHSLRVLVDFLGEFKGSFGMVYSRTLGFLGDIIAAVTIMITSSYLLLEERNFLQFIASLVPHSRRPRVTMIMDRIRAKMGNWLRGQLTLMITIGILTAIAMGILGVPYALLLGLWAGIMEVFPFIGPVIGAAPGVFLAFSLLGPLHGFIALAIYILIQQFENQFLVPKIMSRALGLSPVVIIFSLLIGGKLLGIIGVMIAVPIAAALSVIFEEWKKESKIFA